MNDFDRRALLRLGLAGGGLAAMPAALHAQLLPMRGFTHSVASGDPAATSVLLWTRYIGTGDAPATLRAEVAEDAGFGRVVARVEGAADGAADWCARLRATGLTPGKWYFYRFTAPDGTRSDVGRTRTLPVGAVQRFNIAVLSCANKAFGYFNAYGHIAKRTDVDLVVHVGDYLYEYKRGVYPVAAEEVAGRVPKPVQEIVALDDYRARYADYRLDPDLQAIHRNFPIISIWDDHEFANDAWTGGAENHQPDEGDWEARKAHAKQAYHEWLPVATRAYNRYDIGDLVSMMVVDTRVEGRNEQLDTGAAIKGGKDALIAFRDGPWGDPQRTLLGKPQEDWVAAELRSSTAAKTRWQLLAQQIVMGNVFAPKAALDWIGPNSPARIRNYVVGGIAAAAVGLPQNMDAWGGYPAARSRLLKAAQEAGSDLVVVSGDSHNAWACDLSEGGKPAGVEFAGHSVTSPGYEGALKTDPLTVAAGLVASSPELKWADTSHRGYVTVSFTPTAARAEWVFMKTVLAPSLEVSGTRAATVQRGRKKMALV